MIQLEPPPATRLALTRSARLGAVHDVGAGRRDGADSGWDHADRRGSCCASVGQLRDTKHASTSARIRRSTPVFTPSSCLSRERIAETSLGRALSHARSYTQWLRGMLTAEALTSLQDADRRHSTALTAPGRERRGGMKRPATGTIVSSWSRRRCRSARARRRAGPARRARRGRQEPPRVEPQSDELPTRTAAPELG